jgi:hypothetical protein
MSLEDKRRATGSRAYLRAFMKYVSGLPMSARERMVLQAGRAGAEGYAVPPQMDPTNPQLRAKR